MASKNVKKVLEVTVNGMTTKEAISAIQRRMDTVQKSAFNIAVLAAYSVGVTIPAFDEKGEAVNDKPIARKDFYTAVNRSKSTMSRWLGALELIIKAGDFTLFASGLLPFNYDKVYLIYNNLETLKDNTKTDLFGMSLKSLEALVDENKPEETTTETSTTTEEETTTEETSNDEETCVFNFEGTVYTVSRAVLADFIKANCKVYNK